MMKTKNIAFIMSVYKKDCPEKLRASLESMLSQTIESDILIYRDGLVSKELSIVLEDYKTYQNIFIYEDDENKGLAFALNYLIDVSIGRGYEFLARMDSDDLSRPGRLEKQVEFLFNNDDVDVVGASCREFGASFALAEKHLPTTHKELMEFSITRCPFVHPTVMFRTSVFENGSRYPTNTKLTEDMALWYELLKKGVKFSNLNEVLLDYYLDENTISRRQGIGKAISEFTIRIENMHALNKTSFRNYLLISSRLIFHILPNFMVKYMYKNKR
ncbi:glycosyltransferase [Vibrio renipiscarius]|uniref:Glycosyltransferase 2-like domain-containing protein n=1 Tax=Vibrio renipiscarius TaxID=1461322 RepID=A0A0C2JUF4_9VIBR|nr:glycosyltransferase [Vibrio renipiscarius]KII81163.1 hypothetical protein OJ16_02625 [Vibrio renipiscarius]KII81579.1 hypothetical protein PL18_03150 [Vibrio renipiscarius]